MSARIEAERPRPLGLGSREPVRLAGRALKTIFTAFKTGTLSDRNKKGYQASPPSGVATTPWTPSVKRGVDPDNPEGRVSARQANAKDRPKADLSCMPG